MEVTKKESTEERFEPHTLEIKIENEADEKLFHYLQYANVTIPDGLVDYYPVSVSGGTKKAYRQFANKLHDVLPENSGI